MTSEIKIPDITSLDELKRAEDREYSSHIIICDPKVRGFAVCTQNEKCNTCPYALAHLNPEIPPYEFMKKVSL